MTTAKDGKAKSDTSNTAEAKGKPAEGSEAKAPDDPKSRSVQGPEARTTSSHLVKGAKHSEGGKPLNVDSASARWAKVVRDNDLGRQEVREELAAWIEELSLGAAFQYNRAEAAEKALESKAKALDEINKR